MDWLQPWPLDARLTVANRFLATEDELSDVEKKTIIQLSIDIHDSSEMLIREHFARYQRPHYQASIVFLEMIYIFKEKLKEKRR